MLLLIDVGNTNIVFGIHNDTELLDSWRMATATNRSVDEMGLMILQFLSMKGVRPDEIDDIVIASVVPPIMYPLLRALKRYVGKDPIVVDGNMDLDIRVKYDNPHEVGADRIVNAIAVYEIYGGPSIIVDFGTATTFCAIDAAGDYLGGAILPGIKISLEALFNKAAKLPRIEIVEPHQVIGTNTVGSMQSGIYYGYAGSVDYIVEKMSQELSKDGKVNVVATGGLARLIAGESRTIGTIDRSLTLKGLKIIYDRMKKGTC